MTWVPVRVVLPVDDPGMDGSVKRPSPSLVGSRERRLLTGSPAPMTSVLSGRALSPGRGGLGIDLTKRGHTGSARVPSPRTTKVTGERP